MKHTQRRMLTTSILSIVLAGCGDSTNSSEKGHIISGYIDNEITVSAMSIAQTDNSASVDKIVVMYDDCKAQQTYDVNNDGSFAIDVGNFSHSDLVMLGVNSASNAVVNNIKVEIEGVHLDSINADYLSADLELGTIDAQTLSSEYNSTMQSGLLVSESNLRDIARSDDGVKLCINRYRNPDYQTQIQAIFNMPAANHLLNSTHEPGYLSLDIFRPVVITKDALWNNINTASLSYQQDGTNLSAQYRMDNYGDQPDWSFYEFSEFDMVRNISDGDWLLKGEGSDEIKAKFIYSDVKPFDADNNLKIPSPTLEVLYDGNMITGIKVQWYMYNPSSGYTVVPNMNTLRANQDTDTDAIVYALRDSNGNNIAIFKEENGITSKWSGTFTPDAPVSIVLGRRFEISYEIGQISYQFLYQFDESSDNFYEILGTQAYKMHNYLHNTLNLIDTPLFKYNKALLENTLPIGLEARLKLYIFNELSYKGYLEDTSKFYDNVEHTLERRNLIKGGLDAISTAMSIHSILSGSTGALVEGYLNMADSMFSQEQDAGSLLRTGMYEIIGNVVTTAASNSSNLKVPWIGIALKSLSITNDVYAAHKLHNTAEDSLAYYVAWDYLYKLSIAGMEEEFLIDNNTATTTDELLEQMIRDQIQDIDSRKSFWQQLFTFQPNEEDTLFKAKEIIDEESIKIQQVYDILYTIMNAYLPPNN